MLIADGSEISNDRSGRIGQEKDTQRFGFEVKHAATKEKNGNAWVTGSNSD